MKLEIEEINRKIDALTKVVEVLKPYSHYKTLNKKVLDAISSTKVCYCLKHNGYFKADASIVLVNKIYDGVYLKDDTVNIFMSKGKHSVGYFINCIIERIDSLKTYLNIINREYNNIESIIRDGASLQQRIDEFKERYSYTTRQFLKDKHIINF